MDPPADQQHHRHIRQRVKAQPQQVRQRRGRRLLQRQHPPPVDGANGVQLQPQPQARPRRPSLPEQDRAGQTQQPSPHADPGGHPTIEQHAGARGRAKQGRTCMQQSPGHHQTLQAAHGDTPQHRQALRQHRRSHRSHARQLSGRRRVSCLFRPLRREPERPRTNRPDGVSLAGGVAVCYREDQRQPPDPSPGPRYRSGRIQTHLPCSAGCIVGHVGPEGTRRIVWMIERMTTQDRQLNESGSGQAQDLPSGARPTRKTGGSRVTNRAVLPPCSQAAHRTRPLRTSGIAGTQPTGRQAGQRCILG